MSPLSPTPPHSNSPENKPSQINIYIFFYAPKSQICRHISPVKYTCKPTGVYTSYCYVAGD